jgi:membrane protease YdiL (CAAX protease family)
LPWRPTAAALVSGLVAHNVVVHRLLPAGAELPAKLAFAAAATLLARLAGATWAELGLSRVSARHGLRVGLAAGGSMAAAVLGAAACPTTRPSFDDARARGASSADAGWQLLVRIPLATALHEELVFRGVLPVVLGRALGRRRGQLAAAALFGLWHVLPTWDLARGNAAAATVTTGPGRAAAAVAAVLMTAASAPVFSALQRRSGSVLAPTVAHAALNDAAFLAGLVAANRPHVAARGRHGGQWLSHRRRTVAIKGGAWRLQRPRG